jgi:hypothetical protein
MIKLVIEGLGLEWMKFFTEKNTLGHKLLLMATEDWQLSGFYFYSHRRRLVNVLQVFYISFKKVQASAFVSLCGK